ncbi:MAG: hypothetical protein KME16_27485 [Scytolyngbya sp. HA4215-MV1]|nr:hypothetical protein [Scytolyngbya sp. HA4215-MV1]
MSSQRILELIIKVRSIAADELKKIQSELTGITTKSSGLDNVGTDIERLGDRSKNTAQSISSIAFAFNNIVAAVQTALNAAKPFYDYTIGAAEKLNSQILSSQTSLAATSRVFKDGIEITDPSEKIDATKGEIEEALKQIEKDTILLTGITSEAAVSLFQTTLTNVAALTNQAKGLDAAYNDPIKAATLLTKGFASGLSVLGINAEQARFEINSLLSGNITQDSDLAKKLGYTPQDIARLKSQNQLVTDLSKRLETFVVGNAKASQSVSGQFSNLVDLFQLFGRELGKPLLQPLVSGLQSTFELLNNNRDSLIGFATGISESITNVVLAIGPALKAQLPNLTKEFASVFDSLKQGFAGLGSTLLPGLQAAFKNLAPVFASNFRQVFAVGQLLSEAFAGVGDDIGRVLGGALNAITGLLAPIGVLINNIGTIAAKAIGTVINSPIDEFIRSLTTGAIGGLLNAIGTLGGDLARFLQSGFNELFKAADGLAESFGGFNSAIESVSKAFEPFTRLAVAAVSALYEFAKVQLVSTLKQYVGAFEEIANVIGTVAGLLTRVLSPVFNEIGFAIKGSIESLAEFQKAFIGKVVGTIEQVISNPAFKALSKALGIDTKAIQAGLNEFKKAYDDVGSVAERTSKKLESEGKKSASATSFQSQALTRLGTQTEQVNAELERTANIVNAASGKQDEFAKALQDRIKAIQNAVKTGVFNPEQAQAELEKIASNANASIDIQQNAADTIAKIRKDALDQQRAELQSQVSEIEAAVTAGTITEVDGARQVTALKQQEYDIQLADLQDSISREQDAIEKGNGDQVRLQSLQSQQRKLQAEREKAAIDGEKRIQQARINEIQKAEDKANEAIKAAELSRSIETQKLINADLITKEEADQRRLKSAEQTIKAEFEAEKASLAALEKIPKGATPELERDRQRQISAAKQKANELTLRLVENERAQQEALTRAIQARIDKQLKGTLNAYTAESQELQKQLQLQDSLNATLENRKKLIDAQKRLQESVASAQQSKFSNAIRLLESQFAEEDRITESKKRRKELEERAGAGDSTAAEELKALDKQEARLNQINQLKVQAKLAEIAAAEQVAALAEKRLEIEELQAVALEKQKRTQLELQAIEAKAATAQAVADLAKAKADKSSTPEALEAARLQVSAAQQRESSVSQQQQVFEQGIAGDRLLRQLERQLEVSEAQQKVSNLRADLATLTPGTNDDRQAFQQQLAAARGTNPQAQQKDQQLSQLLDAQKTQIKDIDDRISKASSSGDRKNLESLKDAILSRQPPQLILKEQLDIAKVSQLALEKIHNAIISLGTATPAQTTVQVNQQIQPMQDPNQVATIAAKRVTSDITKALQLVK